MVFRLFLCVQNKKGAFRPSFFLSLSSNQVDRIRSSPMVFHSILCLIDLCVQTTGPRWGRKGQNTSNTTRTLFGQNHKTAYRVASIDFFSLSSLSLACHWIQFVGFSSSTGKGRNFRINCFWLTELVLATSI